MLKKLINKNSRLGLGLFNGQFQRGLQNFCSYLILCKISESNLDIFNSLQNKHKDNFSFLEFLNLIEINNKKFNGNKITFSSIKLTSFGEDFFSYIKEVLSKGYYSDENLDLNGIDYLVGEFLKEKDIKLNIKNNQGGAKYECPRGNNGIFLKRFGTINPRIILYKFFQIISKSNENYYLNYVNKILELVDLLNIGFDYVLEYNVNGKTYKDTIISFLGKVSYFNLEDLSVYLKKYGKNKSQENIFNDLYIEYIEHIEEISIIKEFPEKVIFQKEIYTRILNDIESVLYFHFKEYKKENIFPNKLNLLMLLGEEFYVQSTKENDIIYLIDYDKYNQFIKLNHSGLDEVLKNKQIKKRNELKQKIIEKAIQDISNQKLNKKEDRDNEMLNMLKIYYGYKSQLSGELRITSGIYSIINHDLEVHHIREKNCIKDLQIGNNGKGYFDCTPSNLVVLCKAEHKLFPNYAEIMEIKNGSKIILKRILKEDNLDIKEFKINHDQDFYKKDLIPEYRENLYK